MIRLPIVILLTVFVFLSLYRFHKFTPPPPPPDYPYVSPYPGIGYIPQDPKRDVTYLVDNLSLPQTVTFSPTRDLLLVTQTTQETFAFSKDSDGSFSIGPVLYFQQVPPPPAGPDLSKLITRHPTAIEKSYPGQPTNSVVDPQTGFIYFADYLEGRLYRIK